MSTGKEKRDRAKELLKDPVVIDVEKELWAMAEEEMRKAMDKKLLETLNAADEKGHF